MEPTALHVFQTFHKSKVSEVSLHSDGKILLVGYPRNDTKDLATPPSVNAAHHIRNAHNEDLNPDCLAFNNNDSGQGASSRDYFTNRTPFQISKYLKHWSLFCVPHKNLKV